jgi:quercetin dioxygenase-like cupin family protein
MQPREANRQLTMPDGATFVVVESGLSNDGAEIIFEITMAPGAMGPPRHSHPAQEESWTVPTGELSVLVNSRWQTLVAGESLTISPGVVHTLANRSAATVRFLPASRRDAARAGRTLTGVPLRRCRGV